MFFGILLSNAIHVIIPDRRTLPLCRAGSQKIRFRRNELDTSAKKVVFNARKPTDEWSMQTTYEVDEAEPGATPDPLDV